MIAYTAILGTAFAALMGAPLWTAIIGVGILTAISVSEHRKLTDRFASMGGTHVLSMATWQSAGHALIAIIAAFALGAASRFLMNLA